MPNTGGASCFSYYIVRYSAEKNEEVAIIDNLPTELNLQQYYLVINKLSLTRTGVV